MLINYLNFRLVEGNYINWYDLMLLVSDEVKLQSNIFMRNVSLLVGKRHVFNFKNDFIDFLIDVGQILK
jgi:hypothetical protein